MIKQGDMVWHDTWSNDRSGFFVIECETTPGRFKGRRVMKRDGTTIKNTKLREYFDGDMKPVTPEDLTKRFDNAVKYAEDEFNYLMNFIK